MSLQGKSSPTPAPVGQRLCRSNQQRISRSGVKNEQVISPALPLLLSHAVGLTLSAQKYINMEIQNEY
jgi:hypothetical protein